MPNMETTKSYIYDLDNHKFLSDSYCLISGIGYEYRVDHSSYSIDCMNAPRNECTFQYTVSGEGALVINKKIHLLHAGQAFLVEKPGQFRYYLPKCSSHWEFKWISMNVPSIFYWQEITDHYGRIIELSEDSPPCNIGRLSTVWRKKTPSAMSFFPPPMPMRLLCICTRIFGTASPPFPGRIFFKAACKPSTGNMQIPP